MVYLIEKTIVNRESLHLRWGDFFLSQRKLQRHCTIVHNVITSIKDELQKRSKNGPQGKLQTSKRLL